MTEWNKLNGLANSNHPLNLFVAEQMDSNAPKKSQVYGITGRQQGFGKVHCDPTFASGINVQGEGSKIWLIIHKDSEADFYKHVLSPFQVYFYKYLIYSSKFKQYILFYNTFWLFVIGR